MKAQLRKFLDDLAATFWLVPALVIAASSLLAIMIINLDRGYLLDSSTIERLGLYDGGASGARGLLGAIAASAITVAGTLFSITIAALSLAAGQMGPRLLYNFTRDRGNQLVLGVFLGTFVYALLVLRVIRAESDGNFVPHLAVTVSILLALVCVAALVWFVGHIAGRINVETVTDLVSKDLDEAIVRLTTDEDQPRAPSPEHWDDAVPVTSKHSGYLQHLDDDMLADWAVDNETAIRMLVGPGRFVFPGAPVALVKPPREGAQKAVGTAMALGTYRSTSADLEFAVRQLVEVALRALSPGINDPHTAIGVLDKLGAGLCRVAGTRLPSGVAMRGDRAVLVVPLTDYDGLVDAMFHTIRQSAAAQPSVLIRMLEVLTAVAHCEREPERLFTLQRHARLIVTDARRASTMAPSDLDDVKARYSDFENVLTAG